MKIGADIVLNNKECILLGRMTVTIKLNESGLLGKIIPRNPQIANMYRTENRHW